MKCMVLLLGIFLLPIPLIAAERRGDELADTSAIALQIGSVANLVLPEAVLCTICQEIIIPEVAPPAVTLHVSAAGVAHVFHHGCLQRLVGAVEFEQENITCPLCRVEISLVELRRSLGPVEFLT